MPVSQSNKVRTKPNDWAELLRQLNTIFQDIYSKMDQALQLDGKGVTVKLEYGGLGTDVSAFDGFVYITSGAVAQVTHGLGLDLASNVLTIKVKADSGILLDTNGISVELKAGGGIAVDSDGLYLDSTSYSFKTIACPSGTNPVADAVADTLNFAAGTGVSITGDETSDTITIAAHARQHSITSTSDHTSTATAGQILKADSNGLPVDATNTDAQVSGVVSKVAAGLAGTKVYYVADSSGGATTRKLTFTDGILTAET